MAKVTQQVQDFKEKHGSEGSAKGPLREGTPRAKEYRDYHRMAALTKMAALCYMVDCICVHAWATPHWYIQTVC